MNSIRPNVILLLAFTMCLSVLRSQDAYLKQYSTESGLPSSTVYSVFQQSNGFIWFCLDVGVCRFDGVNYELFTTEDGLPGNEVFGIFEDSNNRLWFRTLNGRIGYYHNGNFYNQQDVQHPDQLISGYISSITEDWNKNIYFSTSKGFMLKISPEYELDTLHVKDLLLGVFAWQADHRLFLVGAKGIYEINSKMEVQNKVFDFEGRLFHKRAFFAKDRIYFSNGGNLEQYSFVEDTSKYIGSFPDHIISLTQQGSDLYIGTRSGLYHGRLAHPHNFKPVNSLELSQKEITSIQIDNEGNTWYSTLHNGVFMAPNRNIFLVSGIRSPIKSLYNLEDSLLYAGSNQGIYYQLNTSNSFNKEEVSTFNGAAEIVGFSRIRDDFWIFGKHVFINISPDGKKRYFILGGNGLTIDSNGDYLWSSHKEVVFLPDTVLANYLLDESCLNNPKMFRNLGDKLLSDSRVHGIIQERVYVSILDSISKTVWFASENGLLSLKQNEQEAVFFSSLPHVSVKDLVAINSKKMIAIATDGEGLIVIDDNSIITKIGIKEGLPSNSIKCLAIDKDTLWVGTLKGLAKITTQQGRLHVTRMNFVGSRGINDIALFNSNVYLATDNGIEYFDRNSVGLNSSPLVYINAIYSESELINKDNFVLDFDENNVRFEFTGLSYQNYGQVSFHYRLHGLDNKWNATTSRVVEYSALPAGDYLFEVKAVDAGNTQSTNSAQIEFKVLRPFWQQWWFILSIILVFTFIIVVFWRIRMKFYRQSLALIEHEKQQIEIERNLSELEQQALRMQMNPHFIFNALNTIKGFYAEKSVVQAKNYISVFSKLMRAILDTTSDFIPIEKEIEILQLYLQLSQIRYTDKFLYQIDVDPQIDVNNTGVPPMLFQPFVENAIIHGLISKDEPGKVNIRFSKKEDQLIISITDNGIGRRNSAEINKHKNYNSKATDIIEKRLWYLSQKVGKKYDLRIEDLHPTEFNAGTKVEISLPLVTLI